jgi:mannose-6-phosphate isomerase-like protein (cupin superfamily)
MVNEGTFMQDKFNPQWNPHYDFTNLKNLAEIEKQEKFGTAFKARDWDYVQEAERRELGGVAGYAKGVVISKEWGTNVVLDFYKDGDDDICIKEIGVNPNCMLSLQSHLGRQEKWEVLSGTLSAIADGKIYEISAKGCFDITNGMPVKISDNNYIELPKGVVHCMINRHDELAVVKETQRGITLESDNKRYIDQIRNQAEPRATIPLTTENQYECAKLYWRIENEIAQKAGFKVSYKH